MALYRLELSDEICEILCPRMIAVEAGTIERTILVAFNDQVSPHLLLIEGEEGRNFFQVFNTHAVGVHERHEIIGLVDGNPVNLGILHRRQ